MFTNRCNDPALQALGDEPGSDVCGCSRAAPMLVVTDLVHLERALLLASRSDDLDSETAAFVTELQDKITAVLG